MRKFKPGDRVILTDNNYHPTRHCPVWGTSKASVGTILTITDNLLTIQWDNGAVSSHFFRSLTLYGKVSVEPNYAFTIRKRSIDAKRGKGR